ncbi:AI-2E family transporter [Mangrovicoccus sp. HB161399]|uniref:AI-2E family transporter n=1 Tax=Mangrovicoccus sp. HB161399 TaxID=2720392 RepID=UPI001552294A
MPAALPEGTRRLVAVAASMVIAACVLYALAKGAPIFVPLAEALIVWFVLNHFARTLRRLPGLGPKMGQGAAVALAAGLIALAGMAAVYSGVRSLLASGPQSLSLQASLDPVIARASAVLGADSAKVLDGMLDAVGLEQLMHQVVMGVFGLVNQFGVVAIYVAFLLADQALFRAKIAALFPDPAKRAEAERLLAELGGRISSYLWIMTRLSALTAAASWAAMAAFGLPNAMFWAILIFVLNFIPTIGSILGVLLPTAFAILQFPELLPVALLASILGLVQFTVGNVIFPRMAGQSLNMSLVVTIFALFLWGTLWGVTGLFLAVPVTAMIIIVSARFEASRPLAVLLSRTGSFEAPPVPAAGSAT